MTSRLPSLLRPADRPARGSLSASRLEPAHTARRPSSRIRWIAGLLALAAASCAQAQIGLTELTADGLGITLVYPTAATAAPYTRGPFVLQVAKDAPLQPAEAGSQRRQVVVLSHGTAGSPLSDHGLAATLARAGFVVAQPLHRGDNYLDASAAGPESWKRRPAEVTLTLDALGNHPVWGPQLALDRVGVHGMSAGGVTALTLAGAPWRMVDLIRHCQANADDDPGFCFIGMPDPAQWGERRQRYASLPSIPERFLPAELTEPHGAASGSAEVPDPRVVAVTVSVPVAAVFSDAALRRIRLPVGVVSAGRDTLLLPRYHSDRVLKACEQCRLLARLDGAAHMDLLEPWPPSVAEAVAAKQARGGAPEPGFDPALRQTAFEAIAVFFKRSLQP